KMRAVGLKIVMLVTFTLVCNTSNGKEKKNSLSSPCTLSHLGLTCNYINKAQDEEVDLAMWGSAVFAVFIHNAHGLRLHGAACKMLRIYNSTVIISPHQQECPPRNVLIQYSSVNRIPGRILELVIFYSELQQLDELSDLNYAYLTNSRLGVAAMKFVSGANIDIVNSEIASLESVVVGANASITFSGSNITIPEQGHMDVDNLGELTLEETMVIATSPQAISILPGGKLNLVSPPKKLNLFDFSNYEEVQHDGPNSKRSPKNASFDKMMLFDLFTDPQSSHTSVLSKCDLPVLILCYIASGGNLCL
ncbi:hypothetical protein OTU49_007068, partial [Cherax quadricarinatus]